MNKLKTLKRIQAKGFMTGSVKWGCDNPKDEDWVISAKDWSGLFSSVLPEGIYYHQHDEYPEEGFRSFNMDHNGVCYNFLIMWQEYDVREYKLATRLMMKVPVRYIQDKVKRVALFEAFKELVRKPGKSNSVKGTQPPLPLTADDIPF